MKTTLNPFENAKRTAQGTGGVSPSVIEEIQAEITVLGSQNETQAQDIVNIKAQLEELAGAYSTTEHKIGRKWVDGKDIFEKVVPINLTAVEDSTVTIGTGYNYIETMLHSVFIAVKENSRGCESNCCYVTGSGELRIHNIERWTELTSAYVIIQYTKTGA